MYLLRHMPAEKYRLSDRQIAAKSEREDRRRHMDAAEFPKSRNDIEMKPARHRACLPRPKPGATLAMGIAALRRRSETSALIRCVAARDSVRMNRLRIESLREPSMTVDDLTSALARDRP